MSAPRHRDTSPAARLAADRRTERRLTWKGAAALALTVALAVARTIWWT